MILVRRNNGSCPSHWRRGSGSIARKGLQALEQLKLVEKDALKCKNESIKLVYAQNYFSSGNETHSNEITIYMSSIVLYGNNVMEKILV